MHMDDLSSTAPDGGEQVPDFLQRLGLGLDADVRAIKRAYARELKQIDQEHDAATFQDLRGAYEVALRWHAWYLAQQDSEATGSETAPGEAVAEPESAPAAPAAAPASMGAAAAPPMPEPQQLARQTFERFTLACKLLSQGRMRDDVDLWRAELQRQLDHDDLLNITARTMFEALVAHQFLGPWEAGHASLFAAAAIEFDWNHDRRRLHQFGRAGHYLDQAIAERAAFDALSGEESSILRKLLALLREGKAPAPRDLARVPTLEKLIERFPRMMELNIAPAVIAQWREAYARPVPAVVDTTPEPVLDGHRKTRGFDGAWIFFAFLAAFYLWKFLSGPPQHSYQPPPVYQGAPGADVNYGTGIAPVPPKVANLKSMDEVRNDITQDIRYQPGASVAAGELGVSFTLFLDEFGNLIGMNRDARSADPAFDEAVEAAIRRAAPFPAGKMMVGMRYGVTVAPRTRKRTAPEAQPQRELFQPRHPLNQAPPEPGESRAAPFEG